MAVYDCATKEAQSEARKHAQNPVLLCEPSGVRVIAIRVFHDIGYVRVALQCSYLSRCALPERERNSRRSRTMARRRVSLAVRCCYRALRARLPATGGFEIVRTATLTKDFFATRLGARTAEHRAADQRALASERPVVGDPARTQR